MAKSRLLGRNSSRTRLNRTRIEKVDISKNIIDLFIEKDLAESATNSARSLLPISKFKGLKDEESRNREYKSLVSIDSERFDSEIKQIKIAKMPTERLKKLIGIIVITVRTEYEITKT